MEGADASQFPPLQPPDRARAADPGRRWCARCPDVAPPTLAWPGPPTGEKPWSGNGGSCPRGHEQGLPWRRRAGRGMGAERREGRAAAATTSPPSGHAMQARAADHTLRQARVACQSVFPHTDGGHGKGVGQATRPRRLFGAACQPARCLIVHARLLLVGPGRPPHLLRSVRPGRHARAAWTLLRGRRRLPRWVVLPAQAGRPLQLCQDAMQLLGNLRIAARALACHLLDQPGHAEARPGQRVTRIARGVLGRGQPKP